MEEKRYKLRLLYNEQYGFCLYCRAQMILPDKGSPDGRCDSRQATIEHLMPKALGGGNRMENLAATCFECNNKRGDGADDRKHAPFAAVIWSDE